MIATLVALAAVFAELSLLAIGGGNAIIPAMQRVVVTVHHWVSAREFLDLFGITRATPGPGSTIVLLIGQKVAGLPGALVAGVAMYTPSCLLTFCLARVWRNARGSPWVRVIERALAPIAVGLIFASVIILIRTTEHGPAMMVITVLATITLTLSDINPLVVLAAGAVGALCLAIA